MHVCSYLCACVSFPPSRLHSLLTPAPLFPSFLPYSPPLLREATSFPATTPNPPTSDLSGTIAQNRVPRQHLCSWCVTSQTHRPSRVCGC